MIVLTGGAGFIGSGILARLNSSNIKDIWIVDHIVKDDLKKKNLVGKKYLKYTDKTDFLKLVRAQKIDPTVDCIIHMGACSSTTLNDAAYFRRNNFEYSRSLARWARAKKVRFIYASSAATYGDGARGYKDDEATALRLRPLNLYGKSKQAFDLWVIKNGLTDRMVGLKFFNIFGPNEYHKGDMRSVIAKSYPKAVKEGTIGLFKSYKAEYPHGEQKRDFLYVKDAVDVVMFFLEHPEKSGIFNVGSGKACSWNDVAKAIFAALKEPPRVTYFDMPVELRDQYQYFTQADMTRLRDTGYSKSFMELEDAVADYLSYLKENRYW